MRLFNKFYTISYMIGMKYPPENNTAGTWQHTLTSAIINIIVSKSFSAN